jgi:transposase
MLEALIEGQASPTEMAELAQKHMIQKRGLLAKVLEGRIQPHHRFVLTEWLGQIDNLDETLERFNHQVEEYCRLIEEALVLLDTIPGVGREVAEIMVSEIGTDASCAQPYG